MRVVLAALVCLEFGVVAFAGDVIHSNNVPRQVLAFYYGWYGNPKVSGQWVHWADVNVGKKTIGGSTHFPVLGAYDSHDPQVVERHCRDAHKAGLSGFVASWWGRGDFTDQGMPVLLDSAEKAGLVVTAYYETAHPGRGSTYAKALSDMLYLLETYGKHPAWFRVNGKPVVFIYSRAIEELGLDRWGRLIAEVNRRHSGGAVFIGDQITGQAAHVFDGIHTYNITGYIAGKSVDNIRAWARSAYPEWVRIAGLGRIACLTIIPGYDDTKTGRPPPRPNTGRHDGLTYRVLWEEVLRANPDWVLITSWNEWHEGSEIESSAENGERELETTAEFSRKFRTGSNARQK